MRITNLSEDRHPRHKLVVFLQRTGVLLIRITVVAHGPAQIMLADPAGSCR